MSSFLLFACLASLTQAQNPGVVFSRGYTDMAALIKKNTPGLFTSLTVNPSESISFISRDFITQVTIELSSIILKNFVVQSSNINVTFNKGLITKEK